MNMPLSLEYVSVEFGGRSILEPINLSLAPKTIATLVGPNGSGKSTLLSTIAGVTPTATGRVQIDGYEVSNDPIEARKRLGFMVAQEKLPALLTPQQCLQLFSEARGLSGIPESTQQQARDLGLTRWMGTGLDRCSLGTRQKVAVLLALIGNPRLILLDEPMNGLDPVCAVALKQWLSDLRLTHGCSILMATHDLAVVSTLSDHVLVLLDGRLSIDWGPQRLAALRNDRDVDMETHIVRALSSENTDPEADP
ncbi:MAG: ABC transporter ATP-binding protein [Pseudomonadota bacterium]